MFFRSLRFSPFLFKPQQKSLSLLSSRLSRPFTRNFSSKPPSQTHRAVGYWLLGSSSLVFGIIVFGGLTRLTESGLSMTDWHPIKGIKPPTSEEEWNQEFHRYKEFPEYLLLNKGMSLEEFKSIFWMEYIHRMWGRAIGLAFVFPGTYFALRGYMTPAIKKRSLVIAGLIGCQGLIGWWMVKSGLTEEIVAEKQVPRVSQYRLATHLGSALVIYILMVGTGLRVLNQGRIKLEIKDACALKKFRGMAHGTAGIVFLTALSGAFVAGLDAGLVYNSFPYMGQRIIPPASELWLNQFGSGVSKLKNIFENPTTVQLNHRLLAMTTLTAVSGLFVLSHRFVLPKQIKNATSAMMAVVVGQVTLGISTLIYFVPVPLASMHQAGSVVLLTCATWLIHLLKMVPK